MSSLQWIVQNSNPLRSVSLSYWFLTLALAAVTMVITTPLPDGEALELYLGDGSRWQEGQMLKPPQQEAPGSRQNGSSPFQGPLYVSMFDAQCRDSVGCHRPIIDDCLLTWSPLPFQGRSVAANLAPDAVNIPIKGIDGGADPQLEGLVAHINIAHHSDTICKALYTVAHHVADPNLTCRGGNIPIVPVP